MSMTRKHYVEVAAVLNRSLNRVRLVDGEGDVVEGQWEPGAYEALREVAEGMGAVFGRDNGRFDRNRFMDAAGFGDPNGN